MSEDVNARSYDLLNRDMRAILFRILGCLGGCKAKSDYFRAIFSSKDMIFAMLKKRTATGIEAKNNANDSILELLVRNAIRHKYTVM